MNPSSPSPDGIWSEALNLLRDRLNRETYNLWIAPLRPAAVNGESFTLEVDNDFIEIWLRNHYWDLIEKAVTHSAGRQLAI